MKLEEIKLYAYCTECDECKKDYQVTLEGCCDDCGTLVDYHGEIVGNK